MKDSDLLDEIRERRTLAQASWDEIQAEAKKDRLCVSGQPWEALDPTGLKQRKDAKRPALALDEIGQYLNQTVNMERANPRGIRYAPTGNGANDAGAEFYQNHTREIEYRSHATMAYCTALDNAVTASYGWLRITTKREHIRTFNHDLWIEPVVNADQILCDPNAVWPDSRDMTYLYYIEPWTTGEFTRRFPKAKITSFSPEVRKLAAQWMGQDQVQVGEYWKLETYTRKLIAFRGPPQPHPQTGQMTEAEPQTALADELPDGKLPDGVENLREEDVDDTQVEAWLTNGIELLDEIPWKGKYIPFASCIGKVLYVDTGSGSQRKLLSLTRLAREPYMLYCYLRTCEAESVGAVSRSTWVGYEGQFAKPDEWAKANKEPVPYLQARHKTADSPLGTILPLPTKQSWDPPLQNIEAAAEAIRRAIQAAMGIMPLPTPMQMDSQKSGVAMDKLTTSYQLGSFHFKDHYNLMIERVGIILEDAIPHYLDTARDVPTRLPNETGDVARINDPRGSIPGKQGQPPTGDPIFTKGDYRVTVTTGPSTESQRQEASDFLKGLVDNIQGLAPIIGPQKSAALMAKAVKIRQFGTTGDEMIDILSPPPPQGQDGKPLPPEVQAAQQQVQQLQQQVQQLQHEKEVEQTKYNSQKDIEKMKIDSQQAKTDKDDQVKMAIAGLNERVDRMALAVNERKHGRELVHKAHMQVRDHLHDVNVAHQQHRSELAKQIHTQGHAKKMAETQGAVQAALLERKAAITPPAEQPPAGA